MKFTLLRKSLGGIATQEGEKHILLTFDDNYLMQTLNLMHSIVRYNDGMAFVCLCPALKDETKKRLFADAPTAPILIYEYEIDFDLKSSYWPNVMCFRIFSAWLIDEPKIEYCVYMDSDVLCSGSIEKLFYERNVLCMCNELSGNAITLHESEIGTGIYCNSGVMGFNLTRIRELYSFEQLLEAFLDRIGSYHFPDQDFYNTFFRDRLTLWNGLRYNFQAYEMRGAYFYRECLKNCKLIHFAGAKPWTSNAPLFLIRLYIHYSSYRPMMKNLTWLPLKRILRLPIIVFSIIVRRFKRWLLRDVEK